MSDAQTWARLVAREDGALVVFETIGFDPAGRFDPALRWEPCPAGTQQRAVYDPTAKAFTNPTPPPDPGPYVPPPPAPLSSEAVDAERDRRIAAGFLFQGIAYQSRPFDYENIGGASTAALAAMVQGAQAGDLFWTGASDPATGNPVPFAWIAADNSLVPMDAPTVIEFGRAAIAHRQAVIFAGRALKARIAAGDAILSERDDALWPATA